MRPSHQLPGHMRLVLPRHVAAALVAAAVGAAAAAAVVAAAVGTTAVGAATVAAAVAVVMPLPTARTSCGKTSRRTRIRARSSAATSTRLPRAGTGVAPAWLNHPSRGRPSG